MTTTAAMMYMGRAWRMCRPTSRRSMLETNSQSNPIVRMPMKRVRQGSREADGSVAIEGVTGARERRPVERVAAKVLL